MNKRGWLKRYIILGIIILVVVIFFVVVIARNMNCNSSVNPLEYNDKAKEDLRLLFVNENIRIVANEFNTAFPGQEYGLAFGVKNTFNETKKFEYNVKVVDLRDCIINKTEAERLIIFGKGIMSIPGGVIEYNRVLFSASENTESCQFNYRIDVLNANETYGSVDFEIRVTSKSNAKYVQIKRSLISLLKDWWNCNRVYDRIGI